ncbi:sulfatase family protein [Pseudarthrobacter niigatensis]|uniref:Sulfatase n=1 Tax=Pseudarthrobacter niigatensis TaxID=369935 RepID=A0AAJ1SVT7_9MICC|nr:sulfatase [Pseudarthrobacter niigatensis]MDQ0144677.1 putative sulfatase [Pseudarthrobacter niigatensis]MDQ0265323.1 putative sulfatase [Pseudarthrobacter niigatensis]
MSSPNVVWISTHDINPDLGCYSGEWPGADYAHTPNLDRLAAEGARFDRAFAAAPVCAPARSAIMTGCFPNAIGTMHMRTKAVPPSEVKLLPQYFREAGYYCTNNYFTDFQVDVPPTVFDDCSPTAHWRNRPDKETPFFAAFHGMTTHESQIYLDEESFQLATSHVESQERHDLSAAPLPPYYPDTEVFRRAWARYADLITEMDHWVGGLLDQLEEDGLVANTIVVFWSDHGRGMPRAKRWATEAGLRVPLIIRWPGVMYPGSVRTDLVHTMDLAPTMLEAGGLGVPAHMHGMSLLGRDGTFNDRPNMYVYAGRDRMDESEDTSRTVRDERYRYVRNFHPDRSPMPHIDYPDHTATWAELRRLRGEEARQLASGEAPTILSDLQRSLVAASKPHEELYDLDQDPHETCNLIGEPRYMKALARLREVLNTWQNDIGDLGMTPERQLMEAWRPGGEAPVTAAPALSMTEEGVVAVCSTPGASIGWTPLPRHAKEPRNLMDRVTGSPEEDGRTWNLYTGPVPTKEAGVLRFKAWRLGYSASDESLLATPGHEPVKDVQGHRLQDESPVPTVNNNLQ